MIKNQWYAVLASKEVKKNELLSVIRLGEKMVFWRTQEGNVQCLYDRCAHRGAKLSAGKVIESRIQCPFHGFEYDGKGNCTLIPAKGKKAAVPDYIKVRSYHAEDSMNFIWIYWSDEAIDKKDLPPIPIFEELTKEFQYGEIVDYWSVHYSRVIENQLDVIHLPFVHKNTIGRGNKTVVDGPHR